ncbi:MAG TPA: hypothetical protein VK988_19685 [Acidimicrobiales bacterium]|nr:hypothetical protein [Acidimicrobiales bacterium]
MSKTPLDHALDLFVFAPLGTAFAVREAIPELIDKGRDRFGGQVSAARVMGQLAVSQGQREAEKAVAQAAGRLAGLGLIPDKLRCSPAAEPAAPSSGQATPSTEASAPAYSPATNPTSARDVAVAEGRTEPAETSGPDVSAEDLAIPGYDSLSAPQVVQRLAGLSTEELDAVRSYEAATRHRKTILTRISQLQEPSEPLSSES